MFRRDGTNVYTSTQLSFVRAALGTEIEVPTLEGPVSLNIPEGTQTGSVFRLRGKGIPNVRTGLKGDEFVTVDLVTPKNLNRKQKELLQELADISGEKVKKKRKL